LVRGIVQTPIKLSQLVILMERLDLDLRPAQPAPRRNHKPFAIAGAVGSGNLEVLVEPADLGGACRITVNTAIAGYAETWEAVLRDFVERHRLADVQVSINDGGATPAVVSLRLDQAALDFFGASDGRG
jgi:malonate decarboxylase delta subunit